MTALRRLSGTPFDVVYADPPYDYNAYNDLLAAIDNVPLNPEPVVAMEHRRRTDPFTIKPKRLQFQRRAEYGEVWITFFA